MAKETTKKRIETFVELEREVMGGELNGCLVRRQNFIPLEMEGLRIIDCDLEEIGIVGAGLKKAIFRNVNIVGAAMRRVNLSQAHIEDCVFRSCEGFESVFKNSDLITVRFHETPLTNADFTSAELISCVFSESDGYQAKFSKSIIVRSKFENRRLGNAILSVADFSDAILLDVNMAQAELSGASFRNALLMRVNLEDSTLTDADFSGARLVNVNFARAVMSEKVRDEIVRHTVSLGEEGQAILDFMASTQDRVVQIIHALLVGYVLGRTGEEVRQSPPPQITQPTPVKESEKPSQKAPEVSPPPKTEEIPKPTSSSKDKDVYEMFKKIELD